MIPTKATLLEEGTDCESRDYDKTTRLENHDTPQDSIFGRVSPRACNRTRGFSAQYHKSTAIESGAFVRAAVFGRRASNCDTTTMNATRRTPRRCIRNPSYVHSVHSAELGVDTNNRHTGSRFCICVHTSNGISRTTILENVRPRKSHLNKLSNVQSHWTCGHSSKTAAPSCENLCPVQNTPSGHSGHCSGEVTL